MSYNRTENKEINMKQSDEILLQELNNKMLNEVPFAFSRWGDGEWLCLEKINDADCDGNIYYKDLSEKLRGIPIRRESVFTYYQYSVTCFFNFLKNVGT